ncbi:hypothetical protein CEXT_450511 [Caerostris extrusa]|uniref:Uncharacterized protein n=1 Tax=Caerostris extrusa TaxID=172846 RepID=A0AAV4MN96_CAEEX|nr:hypothetical protein CEXT_450511 [Caerostris extrusa]
MSALSAKWARAPLPAVDDKRRVETRQYPLTIGHLTHHVVDKVHPGCHIVRLLKGNFQVQPRRNATSVLAIEVNSKEDFRLFFRSVKGLTF